jgi:hypothetical protein
MQYIPPKHWYLRTSPHGITTQKTKTEVLRVRHNLIYPVLDVGRDVAGWHPVSFLKAPKPSLCLLTVEKSSRHLFSRFEIIPLLF